MKLNKESIQSIAFFILFVVSMLYVGYEFGGRLLTKIEAKRELDSLKMENLKLDIELKRVRVKYLNPIVGDTLIVAENNTIYIGNPYLVGDTIAEIISEALIREVKADCPKLEPKITIGSRGSITYEYDNPNGITIYFTQDKFYQTEENPAKGDIKIDTTAARIGSIVFVLHKDIKEPNYGRGVKIVGGKYDSKKVNYLVYTKLNGELSLLEITHVEDYN